MTTETELEKHYAELEELGIMPPAPPVEPEVSVEVPKEVEEEEAGTPENKWKPDFTKPDPWADMPEDYEGIKTFVPTIDKPKPPWTETRPEIKADVERGLVPKGALPVTIEGKKSYIPQSQVLTIQKYTPELHKVLEREGYDRYIKAIAAEKFVAQQFKKRHTQLPDKQWILTKNLEKIKKDSPEVYNLLTTQGFAAVDKWVGEQRAGYEKQHLAVSMLEKYTEPVQVIRGKRRGGGVDGAKYLRENFDDTKTLVNAGFTSAQIKEWQEHNKKPWVTKTPTEKYYDFVTANFKGVVPPSVLGSLEMLTTEQRKAWRAFVLANRSELTKLRSAVYAKDEIAKPKLSLEQFTANFFAERNLAYPALGFATTTKQQRLIEAATNKYTNLYGLKATATSSLTSVAGTLVSPARALHPEIVFKDISGMEWGIGAAQVALIAVAPAISVIRTAIGTGVARIALGTISAGAGAVFTADTIQRWNKMGREEKIFMSSIDAVLLASALSAFVPGAGGIVTRQITNLASKVKGAGKIKIPPSLMAEIKGKPWKVARDKITAEASRIRKANIRAKALDKIITSFKEVPPKKITWVKARRTLARNRALVKSEARELLKQEARVRALEKRIAGIQEVKLKARPKITFGDKLRRANAAHKKAARQLQKEKALEKRLLELKRVKQKALTWTQRRAKHLAEARKANKARKLVEARAKALQKRLDTASLKLKKARLIKVTWVEARRRRITKLKLKAEKVREIAKEQARVNALGKRIKQLRKERLALRPKKTVIRLIREAKIKQRDLSRIRAREKALNKQLEQIRKRKQETLNAYAKSADSAVKLIKKVRADQWKRMMKLVKEAKKPTLISPIKKVKLLMKTEVALKKILQKLGEAIKKGDKEAFTAAAKGLQEIARKLGKTTFGRLLASRSRLMLKNPDDYLSLVKIKPNPQQAKDMLASTKGLENFIETAERRLYRATKPERKAAIEKAVREAKKQIAVKTKVITPLREIRELGKVRYPLVTPKKAPITVTRVAPTVAPIVTEKRVPAVRKKRVPIAKPAEKVKLVVAGKEKAIPQEAFRTKTFTKIAEGIKVSAKELVVAIAAVKPSVREVIEEAVKTSPIPEVKKQVMPEPAPAPEPVPEPVPEPIKPPPPPPPPPLPTKPVKPPIKPPIITTQEVAKEKIARAKGALAWRQGEVTRKGKRVPVWYVILSPYKSEANVLTMLKKPTRAKVVADRKSAYDTIQQLTGKAPAFVLTLDLGIMDIHIDKPEPEPGKPSAIKFLPDPEQRTTGMIRLAKPKGLRAKIHKRKNSKQRKSGISSVLSMRR